MLVQRPSLLIFKDVFGQPFLPWHKAAIEMNLFGKIDQLKAAREGKSLSGEWIRRLYDRHSKTDVQPI
jgi:hypothetical protein